MTHPETVVSTLDIKALNRHNYSLALEALSSDLLWQTEEKRGQLAFELYNFNRIKLLDQFGEAIPLKLVLNGIFQKNHGWLSLWLLPYKFPIKTFRRLAFYESLANRTYTYNLNKPANWLVESDVGVNQNSGMCGVGLGTALVIETESLKDKVLYKAAKFFGVNTLTSEIIDSSHGWASWVMAQANLGYIQDGKTWTKVTTLY